MFGRLYEHFGETRQNHEQEEINKAPTNDGIIFSFNYKNVQYQFINQFKDYLELSSCFIWDRMSFFFKPIVNHMVTLLLGVGGRCKENVSNIDST